MHAPRRNAFIRVQCARGAAAYDRADLASSCLDGNADDRRAALRERLQAQRAKRVRR